MKNALNKVLVALAVLVTTAQVHAYRYTFTNHTKDNLGISMRYHGINEPTYRIYIAPDHMAEFYPGEDGQISGWKIGFVPETFWYLVNPTAAQKSNPGIAPWREFQITFVPGTYYTKALELAEAAAETAGAGAKLGLEAGAAYATGGASTAAQTGAGLFQTGMGMFGQKEEPKKELSDTEKAEAAAKAEKEAKGKALGAAASNVSGLGLGKLIAAVGKLAGESMLRNRHIDIVRDEAGKLIFMSLQ